MRQSTQGQEDPGPLPLCLRRTTSAQQSAAPGLIHLVLLCLTLLRTWNPQTPARPRSYHPRLRGTHLSRPTAPSAPSAPSAPCSPSRTARRARSQSHAAPLAASDADNQTLPVPRGPQSTPIIRPRDLASRRPRKTARDGRSPRIAAVSPTAPGGEKRPSGAQKPGG